jgi:hypothetical protein
MAVLGFFTHFVIRMDWPKAFAFGCLALVLLGCRRDEIRVYRVPKEPKPVQLAMANPHQNSPGFIKWTLPAGWKEELPDSIKAASFSILSPDGRMAQVFAMPLPGGGLTDLDIVNVWHDEVGLPHVASAQGLTGEVLPVGGGEGKLFEMTGSDPKLDGKLKNRILGVTTTKGNVLWIFKMTGEDALVAEQKPVFLNFLKSVTFHEGMEQQLAEMPSRVSSNSKHVPAQADLPKWQAPPNWQAKAPGPMTLAAFNVSGSNGSADVTISKFPGDAGGVVPNVNRWRNQLGLPPAAPGEIMQSLSSFEVANSKASMVEMNGTFAKTGKPTRMLAAIVPRDGETWFYKLMGDDTVVGAEKENFQKFIQSAYR